jgi:hypothetical protein
MSISPPNEFVDEFKEYLRSVSLWKILEPRLRTHEIPLCWAVLIYGDLEQPWLSCYELYRSQGLPDSLFSESAKAQRGWATPRASPVADLVDRDDHQRGCHLLIDKLIAGELRTTCIEQGAPLDSPPTAIHPSRWRVFVPDFETSSAAGPDGVKVVGIRVLPKQDHASTEPPAAPDLLEKFGQESATKSDPLRYPETIAIVRQIGDMPREQLWEEVKRKAPSGKRPLYRLVREARLEVYGPRRKGRPSSPHS